MADENGRARRSTSLTVVGQVAPSAVLTMIRAPTSWACSARGPPWKAAPQVSSSSFLGRQPGIGAIAELLYGVAGEGLAP